MNIKGQIRKIVKRDNCFENEFSSDHNDEFKQLALEYLSQRIYKDSVESAKKLTISVLSKHGKDKDVGPIAEFLEYFELKGSYSFTEQRVHYMHQLNVFLLGLYLYQNVPAIKESIYKEIDLTTSDLNFFRHGVKENWRYSGGTQHGEFLYRWRLASLSHDIGYLISLNKRGSKTAIQMVNRVLSQYDKKIDRIEDIWIFKNINLLKQLDSKIDGISIEGYIDYQKDHPFKGVVYYDHGIISALLLLRLMNEAYEKHSNSACSTHNGVLWHKSFLTSSILQAAIAIALHNIDQDKQALEQCTRGLKIFNLDTRPLSWLLKTSDILQEWDRFARNVKDSSPLSRTNYRIRVYKKTIIVTENFPLRKRKEIKDVIQRYMDPPGIMCIK
jgi:hypothetical protein